MLRNLGRGTAALAALLLLLVGLPGLLTVGTLAVTGQPLPQNAGLVDMLTRPDNGNLFLWALVVVGWGAWLCFAVSVLMEVPAQLRGRSARRVPALGWSQRLAGGLVGAVLALLPTAGAALAVTPTAATVAAHTPVASAPVRTVPGVVAAPVASAPAKAPQPTYTVRDERPAESLWSIAEKELGSGARWKEIARLNQGRAMDSGGARFDEDRPIQPGWVLLLPADAASALPAHQPKAVGPKSAAAPQASTVEVRQGDTLSGIAQQNLGDAAKWPTLYEENKGVRAPDGVRLENPDLIEPGMVLTLPGTGTGGAGTAPPAQTPPVTTPRVPPPVITPPTNPPPGTIPPTTPPPAPTPPATPSPVVSSPAAVVPPSALPSTPPPTHSPTAAPPTQQAGGAAPSHPATAPPTASAGSSPSVPAGAAQPGGSPAGTTPSERSTVAHAQSVPDEVLLGGTAVLAAVLLGALARRRARQSPTRTPGARTPVAALTGTTSAESEKRALAAALASRQQTAGLDLLDRALRSLARTASREGRRLPALTAVRITPAHTVELHLSAPAVPIAPFRAAHASTVWWCTPEAEQILDARSATTVPAPFPALVSLGTGVDGSTVLVDLEAVRLLHLSGPPAVVGEVLRTLALELAFTPLADRITVHTVGVAQELEVAAQGRLRVHPTLEQAVAEVVERDHTVRQSLLDAAAGTPREARGRGVASDAWAPEVVLSASSPSGSTPEALGRLLDANPRGSVAVVAAAPPPGAGPVARWTLSVRGVTDLPGLGMSLELQRLDDREYQRWLALLGIAEEAPPATQRYEQEAADHDDFPQAEVEPEAPRPTRFPGSAHVLTPVPAPDVAASLPDPLLEPLPDPLLDLDHTSRVVDLDPDPLPASRPDPAPALDPWAAVPLRPDPSPGTPSTVEAAHELTLRRLRTGDHQAAEAAAFAGLSSTPDAELLHRDLLCVYADAGAVEQLHKAVSRLHQLPARTGRPLEPETHALLADLRGEVESA